MPRGVAQADEPDLSAAGAEADTADLAVIWSPDANGPTGPAGPRARPPGSAPRHGSTGIAVRDDDLPVVVVPARTEPGVRAQPSARAEPDVPRRPAGPVVRPEPIEPIEPADTAPPTNPIPVVAVPAPPPIPGFPFTAPGTDAAELPAERTRSAPEELRDLISELRTEHRRRRSVRYGRVLTGAVALGLLGVWLLKPPIPGGNENRAPVAFPRLDASGIADASAFRQTDAALRDRFALREYVVSAIGDAAKNKLGVSLSPQVVLGDGGTPFTAEDFTLPCERSFDPAQIDQNLERLRTLGQATGRTLTVAVAPDKSSILTGQLGRMGQALMSCSNRVRTSTEAEFAGSATSPVMTIWDQMDKVEADEPGQAYQHGDTHWTSRGALVFSQALIAKLIAQGEAPASLQGQPEATRGPNALDDADLYRMMGTPREEEVPVWLVHRQGVKVTGDRMDSHYGYGIPIYHTDAQPGVPLIQGKTLVIHDSFWARSEPQLAPYFSDLTIMHWADFVYAADQGDLPEFDRVIIETVQRGWPQRASWLTPGQSAYEVLAKNLSTPRS